MNTYEVTIEKLSEETFVVLAENDEAAKNYFTDGIERKGHIGECIKQETIKQRPIMVIFKKEGNDYGY